MGSSRAYTPKQPIQRKGQVSQRKKGLDNSPWSNDLMGKPPLAYDALDYKGGDTFAPHLTVQLREEQVEVSESVHASIKGKNTGLPDNLKSGIENLSGHSMDDVKVHWGGVVLDSGSDKVILENYAVGIPDQQNKKWDFEMYGTQKEGQTFHEKHQDTGQHGDTPTTIAIEKE